MHSARFSPCAASLLALLACGESSTPPYAADATPPPIERVVLISMDTTRADWLSSYGFATEVSPHVDAIAADGVQFQRAISSNPMTLPSHATMLTGLNPPGHGVHDNSTYQLADSKLTLAEILAARGFATGAVIGALVLEEKFGLAQGFDDYDVDFAKDRQLDEFSFVERTADEVADRALEFIRQHREEPFFLFVHFYDPHRSFDPPEPFRRRFPRDLYAAEIAFVDSEIGRIVATLEELDLYDSTLLIVTSDHGESMGEHGEVSHSFFVYEVTQHIPLVLRAPGMRGGWKVEEPVGLVDIVPTVLSMLDIEVPPGLDGRDLSPSFRGEPIAETERAIYSESLVPTKLLCNPLFALTSARWKYILTRDPELYDLLEDREEAVNRIEENPEVARRLRAELDDILSGRARRGEGHFEVDSATRVALEQLGYLGSLVNDSFAIDPERDDPKDCIRLFNDTGDIVALTHRGEHEKARTVARRVIAQRPEMAEPYRYLGLIAQAEGKWQESVTQLRLYLALATAEASLIDAVAGPNVMSYEKIGEGYNSLGTAYGQLGKYDEAIAAFQDAIRLYPGLAKAHYNLGYAMLQKGRGDEAVPHFEAALRADPEHAGSREQLERLREAQRS